MTRPTAEPRIRRQLIITYEMNDGTNRMECRKMVSHEMLDAVRSDVRGAILWHDVDGIIRNTEAAWLDKSQKDT